jgi:hypothetical protein
MSESKTSYYRIDWADFREFLKAAIFERKTPGMTRPANVRQTLDHMRGNDWAGFSEGQLKRWISEGFETESIHGLSDMIPPIREKRRIVWNEDGDEYHHDMMLSGDDNFMSEWTKRESIPGVAIEAGIMFSGSVSARTVAAYSTWLCKLAFSLESAGIDTEITLDFPSWNLRERGVRTLFHNVVRVKKENEQSDFLSWSPMLSPAALRAFGFTLGYLHADRDNFDCSRSFGRGVPERAEWKVEYDETRRVFVVENQYMSGYGSDGRFPEEKMTNQFRKELLKAQGKS